jgi:hypothetical protein
MELLLGVTGLLPDLLDGPADYLELSVRELGDLGSRARRRVRGRCVITAGVPHVYRLDAEVVGEWAEALEARAVVWILPPVFEMKGDLPALRAASEAALGGRCPVFWDARFRLEGGVHDPLAPRGWPQGARARDGRYWRIHGWHETRWVRRYAESQLLEALTSARRAGVGFLTLAHSQRAEQLVELRRQGRSSGRT